MGVVNLYGRLSYFLMILNGIKTNVVISKPDLWRLKE